MKTFLFALLITIVSCCPKITNTETVTTKTDTIIDTVYVMTPIEVEAANSKPIDINLSTLCDSLYKGQLKPHVRTSEVKRSDGTRQLIAKAEIDSMLHLIVSCKEDAYKDTLDSVRVMNTILRMEIDRKQIAVIEQPLYKNLWFWLFIGLVVIVSFFAFRK